MFLVPSLSTLRASLVRARHERQVRRQLERELADYATPAERDDLAALVAGRAGADTQITRILAGHAERELLLAG